MEKYLRISRKPKNYTRLDFVNRLIVSNPDIAIQEFEKKYHNARKTGPKLHWRAVIRKVNNFKKSGYLPGLIKR